MPLLDHFHPPVSQTRHWESVHACWANEIMAALNQGVLPPGYFAETQVHVGGLVEVDVASFVRQGDAPSIPDAIGGVAVETAAPPTVLVMPAVFPDEIEIQVFQAPGGATLVGAIELISPRNKDRPEARRAFAAKCLAYLQLGVGLLIVDIVTERQANLHDELIHLVQQAKSYLFPPASLLYGVSYRPLRTDPGGDQIEITPVPSAVGQALPTMSLALRRGPTVPIPLEETYSRARERTLL
jgi:hypothetical protein